MNVYELVKKFRAIICLNVHPRKKLVVSLLLSRKLSIILSPYKVRDNVTTVNTGVTDKTQQSSGFWEVQHKCIWVGLVSLGTGSVLNNTCPISAQGYLLSCNKCRFLKVYLHEIFIHVIIIRMHKRWSLPKDRLSKYFCKAKDRGSSFFLNHLLSKFRPLNSNFCSPGF